MNCIVCEIVVCEIVIMYEILCVQNYYVTPYMSIIFVDKSVNFVTCNENDKRCNKCYNIKFATR